MAPEVAAAFDAFPQDVRCKLMQLRSLILETGENLSAIGTVDESLKWGEPSYTTIAGSTVRLGWKKAKPETVYVYFHCQTKLVATFRELYPTALQFEGNRAIPLGLKAELPETALRHCIELALTYHQRKHLPMLGASPMV
ncbi:DUF1801 domain-containing protein [Cerasicoccus frondis]|uniref:DUF1801 domain-containing protein n=1 Tax=Cerasicoccus frondis TaxID=490090 RepID=UPI003CCE4063